MSDNLPNPSGAGVPAVPEQGEIAFRSMPNVFNPNALSPEEKDNFFGIVGARQNEIDGILASAKSPERASKELNSRFNGEWDDDQGLAFLNILGADLPDLQIHGRADGLVISASRLINPNFEGANLEASIFSMSALIGIRARGANLNMAILPFSEISGDFTGVQAVDANFNLARIKIDASGANFTNAFMIGTAGVTARNLQEAHYDHAVLFTPHQQQARSASQVQATLRKALAGGFSVAKDASETEPTYRMPVVHQGMNLRYALEAARKAEGQLWHGVNLSGARLTEFQIIASVLSNSSMAGANANSMRASGLVMLDKSTLNGISARTAWMPGSVHIGTDFTGADLEEIHMPGSVLIDTMLGGVNAKGANIDGMVVVTDRPRHALAIQEQTDKKMRVVDRSELTSEVQSIIAKAKAISIGGSGSQRALKKQQ